MFHDEKYFGFYHMLEYAVFTKTKFHDKIYTIEIVGVVKTEREAVYEKNIQKCVSAMMVMSIIMQATPAHLYAAEQLYDVMKAQNAEVPNDENALQQESLSNENIGAQ